MSRRKRLLLDRSTYYLHAHGYNGLQLFRQAQDYERYLAIVRDVMRDLGVYVIHYGLLPTSVHLIVVVSYAPHLSRAMQRIQLSYAAYARQQYHVTGHVWQGSYRTTLLEPGSWVLQCGMALEWQPVYLQLAQHPTAYPWSSYRAYATGGLNGVVTVYPAYLALGETRHAQQQAYTHRAQALAHHGRRLLERLSQHRFIGHPAFLRRMEAACGVPCRLRPVGRPPNPRARREIAPNPINLPLTATTPQRYRGDPAHRGRSVGSQTDNTHEVP